MWIDSNRWATRSWFYGWPSYQLPPVSQAQRCKGHCGEPCETRWQGPRCLLGAGCESCSRPQGCCNFCVNCQAVCGEQWLRALSKTVWDLNWVDWESFSLVGCGQFRWLFLRHAYQPTFYQCAEMSDSTPSGASSWKPCKLDPRTLGRQGLGQKAGDVVVVVGLTWVDKG
jgi:hypothetical protein